MRNLLIGLGAVAILFGGTTVMAQSALPGDTLYGMKLGFNELISSSLVFSEEAKVNWQIAAAERRLQEAAKASREKQLDAKAQAAVFTNFTAQLKSIDEYITKMRAEGRPEEAKRVAVRIGQALANQAETLVGAQAEAKVNNVEVGQTDSLDFLVLKLNSTLLAAASIAASTLVEDAAPAPEVDPSTVDEWGRPIPGAKAKATTTTDVEVKSPIDGSI